jgi:hypothetical protein
MSATVTIETLLTRCLQSLGKSNDSKIHASSLEYLHSEWIQTVEDLRAALDDETAWNNLKLPARLKIELKKEVANILVAAVSEPPSNVSTTHNPVQAEQAHPINEVPSEQYYTEQQHDEHQDDLQQTYEDIYINETWIKIYSPEYYCYYYYNNFTQQAQWEEPEELANLDQYQQEYDYAGSYDTASNTNEAVLGSTSSSSGFGSALATNADNSNGSGTPAISPVMSPVISFPVKASYEMVIDPYFNSTLGPSSVESTPSAPELPVELLSPLRRQDMQLQRQFEREQPQQTQNSSYGSTGSNRLPPRSPVTPVRSLSQPPAMTPETPNNGISDDHSNSSVSDRRKHQVRLSTSDVPFVKPRKSPAEPPKHLAMSTSAASPGIVNRYPPIPSYSVTPPQPPLPASRNNSTNSGSDSLRILLSISPSDTSSPNSPVLPHHQYPVVPDLYVDTNKNARSLSNEPGYCNQGSNTANFVSGGNSRFVDLAFKNNSNDSRPYYTANTADNGNISSAAHYPYFSSAGDENGFSAGSGASTAAVSAPPVFYASQDNFLGDPCTPAAPDRDPDTKSKKKSSSVSSKIKSALNIFSSSKKKKKEGDKSTKHEKGKRSKKPTQKASSRAADHHDYCNSSNEDDFYSGSSSDDSESDDDDESDFQNEVVADKELITRLREMGFTKIAATMALEETNNSLSQSAFLLAKLQQEGEDVTEPEPTIVQQAAYRSYRSAVDTVGYVREQALNSSRTNGSSRSDFTTPRIGRVGTSPTSEQMRPVPTTAQITSRTEPPTSSQRRGFGSGPQGSSDFPMAAAPIIMADVVSVRSNGGNSSRFVAPPAPPPSAAVSTPAAAQYTPYVDRDTDNANPTTSSSSRKKSSVLPSMQINLFGSTRTPK